MRLRLLLMQPDAGQLPFNCQLVQASLFAGRYPPHVQGPAAQQRRQQQPARRKIYKHAPCCCKADASTLLGPLYR